MKSLLNMLETYLFVLVHPYKIHQSFRHGLPVLGYEDRAEKLSLNEAIGISWIFSIIKGFAKLVLLNTFLVAFWNLHSDDFPILNDIIQSAGFSSYYFFLFTICLDIIFFPIVTYISTEIWSWIIRFFTKLLNSELPADQIADEITTHALSSNLFVIIPFFGDLIQSIVYYFLLYTGLRCNLQASRSLSLVILLSPLVLTFMLLTMITLPLFYLL